MKKALIVIFILTISSLASAKHFHHERYYQDIFCDKIGGETEVIMDDRTRCDCLTKDLAIEVDFAKKFYEAIGQALHYGRKTNKTPGVLLIIEKKSDLKYLRRLHLIIKYYKLPIVVFKIEGK